MRMQFTLPRETLLEAVHRVMTVVPNRSETPVLEHVFLRAFDDGQLHLFGNNLEMEIQTVTETAPVEPGMTTVHGRKLHDILRRLPAGVDVKAVMEDGHLSVMAGRSRFRLATLPADSYPHFEIHGERAMVRIQAAALLDVFKNTAYAMGRNDARHYLNGVYLRMSGNRLTAAATDGHRLALAGAEVGPCEDHEVILPGSAVGVLMRLLPEGGEVDVTLGGNAARFVFGNLTFSTKLIAAKYPDWTRAVPDNVRGGFRIDAGELAAAVNRAAVLSDQRRVLKVQVADGGLRLSCSNAESEEALEHLAATLEPEDFQAEFGLNAAYLADALGLMEGEVLIQLLGDHYITRLARTCEPGRFHIVMPTRL